MILAYPDTGSTTISVTLPNPEFGNSLNVDSGLVSRQARHGEAITYRDTDWPVIRTKRYSFNTVTKTVIDELKDFLDQTAGLKIKITDHNDEESTGFIVSNENEIITTKDSCSYDVSFEFM